jgi:outer membrane protein assembly factor BamB
MPELAQFWNNTNGQLIWEYSLPETEFFGSAKPIAWDNGETAVFVGRNKLVKLSIEGEEIWTWTREAKEA